MAATSTIEYNQLIFYETKLNNHEYQVFHQLPRKFFEISISDDQIHSNYFTPAISSTYFLMRGRYPIKNQKKKKKS